MTHLLGKLKKLLPAILKTPFYFVFEKPQMRVNYVSLYHINLNLSMENKKTGYPSRRRISGFFLPDILF